MDEIRENFTPRYAITFGESAILHSGGLQRGERRATGFSRTDLAAVQARFKSLGCSTKLYDLSANLPASLRNGNEASCLHLGNASSFFLEKFVSQQPPVLDESLSNSADRLLEEQKVIEYDRKFFNARQKKTMNKRARYNTTFDDAEPTPHNSDFSIPTCHPFPPLLRQFKQGLEQILGEKASDLKAEGNYYFEAKSGIGYHGDEERKIVICLSLGGPSTIRFHWRLPGSSEHTQTPISIPLSHGDVYIMSEKCTGYDWKKRSRVRVVHGAGSSKYIEPNNKKRKR
ncbi:hypothetical protein TrVE_jg11660 [Triparma verrucosa]|nr:hypothetical protein TrVE_jg11660 [Triparma verrucosa]